MVLSTGGSGTFYSGVSVMVATVHHYRTNSDSFYVFWTVVVQYVIVCDQLITAITNKLCHKWGAEPFVFLFAIQKFKDHDI